MKSRGRKRLIQLEKHLKDNLSTEVDTTPRIGLLPRNVFIGCTLVLATCCAGGLYWLQMTNWPLDSAKLISEGRSDHRKLKGLKRVRLLYRFSAAQHLEKLRQTNLIHHIAALLLRTETTELKAEAIGTIGLLLRDPILCASAANDNDLLLLWNVFFDQEQGEGEKEALRHILKNNFINNDEKIAKLRKSELGKELLSNVFGTEPA